jgi:hypothetical protein
LRALKATIDLPAANVIATSSEKRIGLDELWWAIDTTVDEASVSGDVGEYSTPLDQG